MRITIEKTFDIQEIRFIYLNEIKIWFLYNASDICKCIFNNIIFIREVSKIYFSIILPSSLRFSGQKCLELSRHQNIGILKIREDNLNLKLKKRTCHSNIIIELFPKKVRIERLLFYWNTYFIPNICFNNHLKIFLQSN